MDHVIDDLGKQMADIRRVVSENCVRVAELGGWPSWRPPQSMMQRIPPNDSNAEGFSVGLACALDLIPRDKQALAAGLEGRYNEKFIMQVRREAIRPPRPFESDDDVAEWDPTYDIDPDSEAVWWLAARNFTYDGGSYSPYEFTERVDMFRVRCMDERTRGYLARMELDDMQRWRFKCDRSGTPIAFDDRGMLAAYIMGHEHAVQYDRELGVFGIGTFHESLGLEGFPWGDHAVQYDRNLSGLIDESQHQQFVRCASIEELAAALAIVRAHFGG